MGRPAEKFLKIEPPKQVSEMKLEPPEIFPSTLLKLDLTNLEPYTEPEMKINVNLGLDQLEESEE